MSLYNPDTIAAIATPPGEGGVGIVRISGSRVWNIADALFQPLDKTPVSQREHGTFAYGKIIDSEGEEIDTGLALIMRAPKSYTCEDVVEIQGHGGAVGMRRILRRCLEAGARMAEPGEFTKRAFLNGRIDLLQAEGIFDLIRARSDRAASAALEQMEGKLSRQFNGIYEAFLEVAANLETTLDFVEDELPDDVFSGIADLLDRTFQSLDKLLDTWDEGRLLREGARVVILGRPNAGKSTLLNALLGFDRAIVSSTAGTTRDTIEEGFVLNGIPLRIIDTAGLRITDDEIEAEGIRRAEAHSEEAHLSVYLIDASQPLHDEDKARLEKLVPERSVIVLNKIDQGKQVELEGVETCLRSGEGIENLKRAMAQTIERGADLTAPPHAVISERHRQLLIDSHREAKQARAFLNQNVEENAVLAAEHLRSALEFLGQVTGRSYHEELLDNIFSRFCIGK
ncbi:tRNA uridine-5-carboxymethylaminomethyl(34) synthesis GTPase MnmE [Pontiella agarivorans]|uniref:tRNA modification GTPase MnmE n=1 Tax=Pontiella agarivorans TaxID=3038953 RepID=A0ABU5MUK9_9BACT|nr:tRNA uridine-5-carboxymethylaminomethyl(34) synthesis GTPase MnmE [Pontiella agarivorans]MDZ8117897.1 tRNA uridine-5-carboxymethylaminomethyl(34) synthesis GTPase MnmE [Pontiella agarivorans]